MEILNNELTIYYTARDLSEKAIQDIHTDTIEQKCIGSCNRNFPSKEFQLLVKLYLQKAYALLIICIKYTQQNDIKYTSII